MIGYPGSHDDHADMHTELTQLRRQVAEAERRNAALVEAVDMIANGHITNTDDAAVVIMGLRRIARNALAAAEAAGKEGE